jgi:hypothetical protein
MEKKSYCHSYVGHPKIVSSVIGSRIVSQEVF